MASLNFLVPPVVISGQRRVRTAATGAKTTGKSSSEEKGIFDWVAAKITKQDQFYETNPLFLKNEDEKKGGTTSKTTSGRRGTVVVPPKKESNGGGFLGGLFSKK